LWLEASFPALGGARVIFSRPRHRFLESNSRSDWFIAFSKSKLEIKFKPFLPPFCVSRVELRDEIVALIFAYPLLSLSYPGDEYVTEERREMYTDT